MVNHKRVQRIWRRKGLKVPRRQPKRGRLWLNDGACIRLRPAPKDYVRSYDIVTDGTANGRSFRMLTILDEYTRECLSILPMRRINSQVVLAEPYGLSYLEALWNTSGRIMDRCLQQRRSEIGYMMRPQSRCLSNPRVSGRTDISSLSTESRETSC